MPGSFDTEPSPGNCAGRVDGFVPGRVPTEFPDPMLGNCDGRVEGFVPGRVPILCPRPVLGYFDGRGVVPLPKPGRIDLPVLGRVVFNEGRDLYLDACDIPPVGRLNDGELPNEYPRPETLLARLAPPPKLAPLPPRLTTPPPRPPRPNRQSVDPNVMASTTATIMIPECVFIGLPPGRHLTRGVRKGLSRELMCPQMIGRLSQ